MNAIRTVVERLTGYHRVGSFSWIARHPQIEMSVELRHLWRGHCYRHPEERTITISWGDEYMVDAVCVRFRYWFVSVDRSQDIPF